MATASLKLRPGVDTNASPVLNEAGISSCNLIRLWRDRTGIASIQKLGGWSKFYSSKIPSIARQVWPWQDQNHKQHLGIGCSTSGTAGVGAPLLVLTSGSLTNITPLVRQDNVAPLVTTTTTSNTVFIDDAGSNINNYTAVFVTTHIAVGGIIVFGFFQCTGVSANQFSINLVDKLGNPLFPLSGTTGGTVAQFTVTSGNSVVQVTLTNHGYSIGDTYPCLVSTTVGGVVIYGDYLVQSVIDANNFTIQTGTQATSSTSGFINGGNAQYDFYIGLGPLPSGTGYGVGGYGTGGYGSGVGGTPPSGDNIEAIDWALDNWGDIFVATAVGAQIGSDSTQPSGTPVFLWDPIAPSPIALALAAGPAANDGCFVAMPQRQIVCWGSTFTGIQDHLLLRWCDVNNYNTWIAQPTNQAGSFRIPRGSKIVGCLQVPNQALVFTDLAVWSMQYEGQPFIYGFNEIGTGCGLIAPKAAAVLNGATYWMSQSQFFAMPGGSGVVPLECPIWDNVFQLMDQTKLGNIRVAPNSRFNEIAWHFTSTESATGENDMYVKYRVDFGPAEGWDYGFNDTVAVARSAWTNQSVLGPPIGADPTTLYLYQHETSNDADGQPMNPFFQTGYFEIGDGQFQTFVDFVLPDMIYGMAGAMANATVLITFLVAQYPGDTPLVFGPYSTMAASQYISTRFRGRLVAVRIESNDVGTWWRLGRLRYRFMQDGRF